VRRVEREKHTRLPRKLRSGIKRGTEGIKAETAFYPRQNPQHVSPFASCRLSNFLSLDFLPYASIHSKCESESILAQRD
jgi:hypothetical protein